LDTERVLTVVLHDGVFGFGKTHTVVTTTPPDGLILGAGRENVRETRDWRLRFDREETLRDPAHVSMKKPSRYVRTQDSMLIDPVTARFLAIDECFMEHPGKTAASIVLSGASHVELHGDTRQIPFINRVNIFKVVYLRFTGADLEIKHYVTRRCPADVCVALGLYYDDYSIRTRSDRIASLSFVTGFDVSTTPYDPHVQYLAMYRQDKAVLLRRGFSNTITVHESEGQTYDRVAVVRLAARKQELFDTAPHVIVALSRHKTSCIYYCPLAASDLMEQRIRFANGNYVACQRACEVTTAGRPLHLLA